MKVETLKGIVERARYFARYQASTLGDFQAYCEGVRQTVMAVTGDRELADDLYDELTLQVPEDYIFGSKRSWTV